MENYTKTTVTEFTLLAFSDFHEFQTIFFIIVLLMYITCILGNITIITLVRTEPSLQTPMYFFISVFAVLEILFVSVTVPKLLDNLIAHNKKISFAGCFAQLYAFSFLGETECSFLAIMVFDRYLAIHNPLRYSAIMNHKFCTGLAVLPWIIGFVVSFIPTVSTAVLDFCGPSEMNHYYCDFAPLQNLACSNPIISNALTSFTAALTVASPFFIIVGFYIRIIFTIVSNMNNTESKQKAFSTCSSHLIVSSMFYGSGITVYINPKGSQYDRFLALTFTVIAPLLNPFIYTLRNKNVKEAFRKSFGQLLKHLPVQFHNKTSQTQPNHMLASLHF
ncbi:olfactory receptor 6C4-like [Xenopus laevis]|uniref:Olfactory receptor 6C4-like n=1 Tax=Xenopus laevis TaxID=8355 RepID=A0A8J1LK33_XENLA|nr:olfactory receptor 6C4-like [Xenopus laevis]